MLKKLLFTDNRAVVFADKAIIVETQPDPDLYGVTGWYKISKDLNEIDYSGNPATVRIWQDSIPRQNLNISFVTGSKISYTGITINDCIKFNSDAVLPAGLIPNKRYFILTVTSSQAQISEMRGGVAVSFADGATTQPAKEYNYAYQSTVANQPILNINNLNGFAGLFITVAQQYLLTINKTTVNQIAASFVLKGSALNYVNYGAYPLGNQAGNSWVLVNSPYSTYQYRRNLANETTSNQINTVNTNGSVLGVFAPSSFTVPITQFFKYANLWSVFTGGLFEIFIYNSFDLNRFYRNEMYLKYKFGL